MRIRIAQSSGIMRDNVRHLFGPNRLLYDFAELVLPLLFLDTMRDETALDVIEKSECLVGFIDGNDIFNKTLLSSKIFKLKYP